MKRLSVLLLMFAVLLSGTCSANSFFKGLVGRWKQVSKTTIVAQNLTFTDEDLVTFRLLKNGTLYAESKSFSDGSLSKSWFYPRGTLRGISYTGGVRDDAESTGNWSIRNGKLSLKVRTKQDGAVRSESNNVIRRVNRNEYVSESSVPGRYRATSTLTRLRK